MVSVSRLQKESAAFFKVALFLPAFFNRNASLYDVLLLFLRGFNEK